MASSSRLSRRHSTEPREAGTTSRRRTGGGEVVSLGVARHLTEGREALSQARWEDARLGFTRALAEAETPEAYEGLALVSESRGAGGDTLVAREAAYRLYLRRGDRPGAARMAMLLGFAYADMRGEIAVGNGWLRRAERLLEDLPPGPELAWLEAWRAHLALTVEGRVEEARYHAERAVRIARELDVLPVETMARGQLGMVRVLQGDVPGGLELLDEAAAAGLGGEHDDLHATGMSACYMLTACEHLLDFARARQWCDRSEAFARRLDLPATVTFCRSHLCKVLLWHGEWDAAERELEEILQSFVAFSPASLPASRVQLAELRRRQGRRSEAHALLDQSEACGGALLVRAALALDEGRETRAVDLIERYFRRLDPNEPMKRAAGLEILARAEIRRGRFSSAEEAVEELEELCRSASTQGLLAAVAAATGGLALARGATPTARRRLEDAIDLFTAAGSPYEAARARRQLARCLALEGRPAEAIEEARRAAELLRELGALPDAEEADELRRSLEDPGIAGSVEGSPETGGGRVPGLTARENEVLALVAEGLGNQEIADRLHLSLHTVKRHVANLLTKLDLPSRTAAAALAVRHGLLAR